RPTRCAPASASRKQLPSSSMSVVTSNGPRPATSSAAVSSPGPISTRWADGVRRRSQSMKPNSPPGGWREDAWVMRPRGNRVKGNVFEHHGEKYCKLDNSCAERFTHSPWADVFIRPLVSGPSWNTMNHTPLPLPAIDFSLSDRPAAVVQVFGDRPLQTE